jgi:hypothetical protein
MHQKARFKRERVAREGQADRPRKSLDGVLEL